ncbi:putative glycine-rich cell wall structural protein 1 [Teratosphaeria destructans]|uniref:Glycine-rich cell wall structural protein 1 n=1 Tax=Teratosphaeria destructans TaxID=418781 RepID=A0A9W7W6H1_9PEZI|nr:putative glycine-rich cell wall structural protein 1 [Teratosphaeria destructans]
MGLFDGRSYSDSERLRPHSTHHTPRSRGASPARSTKSQGFYVRPSAHRSTSGSFFGGSGTGNHGYSSQSRGVFSSFNAFGGRSSSSYYGRRPRDGYISYLVHKLQRMIKELWYYARRHPVKAFFAVIVPLLSAGGAIHGLMRQFGVRIPGLDGRTSYSRGSGGYYGSSGYGGGRAGGGGGLMENAGSLMQIARAFM